MQQIKNVNSLHTVFKIFWGRIFLRSCRKFFERVGNTELLAVYLLQGGKRTEVQKKEKSSRKIQLLKN